MKKKLKTLILGILFLSSFQAFALDALSPSMKIANLIKNSLIGFDPVKVRNGMKVHYQGMKLLDVFGNWKAPELEAISDQLLPRDLDQVKVNKFVDLVAHYAETNVYLNDFLNKAANQDFPVLFSKVGKEGNVVFPDLVLFALALEKLTKAMRANWRVVEACHKIWLVERKTKGIFSLLKKPAYFIKLESVQKPITMYIKYNKTGQLPADFGSVILPLNILEAVAYDIAGGNYKNALAGKIAAKNKPGTKTANARTGQGPSVWAQDKQMILVNMPYPKQWADLYATWNMAFISQFDSAPYLFVKLLIPQVSDYQLASAEYIFNRAFALYTILNYDYDEVGKATQWSDKSLTKFWGSVNKENAEKYEKLVKDTP
ncbi:hypothetical protein HYY75_03675 [bacterium]|nr:hypothetical protein [bacterium]